MDSILIFGTGSVANKLLDNIDYSKVNILAFINSDNTINEFRAYDVISPEHICQYRYDYIVIASGYVKNIIRVLQDQNVDLKKVVSFIYDDSETYLNIAKNRKGLYIDIIKHF